MDIKFSVFLAYLKTLGMEIFPDSFENRIKLQKLAFILGETLKPLYSDFNFYVRGPYSRELARDYYAILKTETSYVPSKEEDSELVRLKSALGELSTIDLEIVSGLLWLIKRRGLSYDDAEEQLHMIKPYLNIEEIWRGANIVKRLLLTETLKRKLVAQLKEEQEEWDRISDETLTHFE